MYVLPIVNLIKELAAPFNVTEGAMFSTISMSLVNSFVFPFIVIVAISFGDCNCIPGNALDVIKRGSTVTVGVFCPAEILK